MLRHPLAGFHIAFGIATFILYGLDKPAARNGGYRTPENLLLLMALIGGWPGALVAQILIRHKSRKRRFQIVFWLTVAVNVFAAGWQMAR